MFSLWSRWIMYPIGWVVFVALSLGFIGWLGSTGEEPDMDAFHARYAASLVDGRMQVQVEETIELRLAGDLGITRELPTRHGETTISYSDFSLQESHSEGLTEEGALLPGTMNRWDADGMVNLELGSNERKYGQHKFVLSYTIDSAMTGTEEFQELYLDTNGVQWPNGFRSFSAEITLDDQLAAARTGDHACYQGKAGSRDTCTLAVDGDTYRVDGVPSIGPRENVTVAIGFERGTAADVIPPVKGASLGWWGIAGLLGIGAAGLAVALVMRARASDLDHDDPGVVTEFTPPEGLLPITAADLLGRPERGAAAHAAWLAVEDKGVILAATDVLPDEDAKEVRKRVYREQLHDETMIRWNADGLPRNVVRLTSMLFGPPGKRQKLVNRTLGDYYDTQAIRDNMLATQRLRKEGTPAMGILWIGGAALFIFGWWQMWRGLDGLGWAFILAGLAATMMLVWAVHIAPVHHRWTPQGHRVRRHLLGLRRFIELAERDRIAWLQGRHSAPQDEEGILHLHEKLLPWAIVFGLEKSWAKELGDRYSRFPELRLPHLDNFDAVAANVVERTSHYHEDRRRQHHMNWATRPEIGQGGVSQFVRQLGTSASSGSSDSGRGWSGGSSSSSSSGGGSRGGGFSGGGIGGGGGGRR